MIASAALHLAALAAVIVAPHTGPVALAVVIANHLAIVVASLLPRSPLLGPNMRRLPDADGAVALTFDDGPDPARTPALLDIANG